MAVRPVDAEKYMELLKEQYLHHEAMGNKQVAKAWQGAMQLLYDMPTLTPPNEIPPCYQPDGDGCAYQCYDGDDEPIEKCKECPLCYSDKQRHYTPPNEPLTLEQLREMDAEPVWIGDEKTWGILQVWDDNNVDAVFLRPRGCIRVKSVIGKKIYRRPPEGEV